MRAPVIALVSLLIFCPGRSVAAADAPPLKIAPDESLPTAKLMEAGVPAPDRDWMPDDYRRLAIALRAIVNENPRKLPRFDSENSGAIMRRLVDAGNFRVLHDRKFPLNVRLPQALVLLPAISDLAMIYAEASARGESFDRELVEVMAFMAGTGVEVWTLVDEMLSTLTPEERAGRASALGTIRSGSAHIVQGALGTFTEVGTYRPAELVRFATLLEPYLPLLIRRLTPDSITEAVVRLRTLASEAQDPALAAALKELLSAVEAGAS